MCGQEMSVGHTVFRSIFIHDRGAKALTRVSLTHKQFKV